MKGKFSERVTPLMTSAMKRACFSLSITQGPAMRKRLPEPMRTLSIWKERSVIADMTSSKYTRSIRDHLNQRAPASLHDSIAQ